MAHIALLFAAVLSVGILHTLVPDHWAPIAVLARRMGWPTARTALAAATAGLGHVTTTLLLGVVIWAAGATAAARFGHAVDVAAGLALIVFGCWVAFTGWREAQTNAYSQLAHAHLHHHSNGQEHVHWHEHTVQDWHVVDSTAVMHEHSHAISGATPLLLILGSSPMIEGLPAFFAASRYGVSTLAAMAAVFACATIGTYVGVTVAATAGLARVSFGPIERYGEFLSGLVVAVIGVGALLLR
jgi:putative Mn2+ efflux pump MntP